VGNVRSPIIGRYLDGMLAYAGLHPGIQILDLRQAAEFPRFKPTDVPPWQTQVDGVVLAAGYEGPVDDFIGWVGRGGVPAVSVRSDIIDPRLPAVFVDPESIAKLAVEHFLEGAVSSFLHLGDMLSAGSRRRAEVFARVLATRGRATAAHELNGLIFGGLDEQEKLARDRRLTELLTMLPRPLGILCTNDSIARTAVLRCQALGFVLGADVTVIGVDDTALATNSVPSITSIKVPCETVAARGLAVVCELIEAGRFTRPELPVELVPATALVARESTRGCGAEQSSLASWLAYLDQHGHRGFSAAQIADELGLSQRTFERQFRKLLGHSPAEEIRRRRLERAKVLLAAGQLPITEIAAELGFSEAAAFSRFFRQHAGCTPSEYRREATERQPG
jgi:LacI family transcriptional regulator